MYITYLVYIMNRVWYNTAMKLGIEMKNQRHTTTMESNPWYIRAFHYLYMDELCLYAFMLFLCILAPVVCLLINHYHPSYLKTFDLLNAKAFIGAMVLYFLNLLLKPKRPYLAEQLGTWITILAIMSCSYAITSLIVITPFTSHMLGYQLAHMDHIAHFNTLAVMNWTNQYPLLMKVLMFCYNAWFPEIVLTPILLSLHKRYRERTTWMYAYIVSLVIGCSIYFFYPSLPPAAVYHNPYFSFSSYDLIQRFYLIRHLNPFVNWASGLIAFPSFHIIIATINLVMIRKLKIYFYPMLIVNLLLYLSTIALGVHYGVDVVAGFIVAGISVLLGHRLHSKLYNKLVLAPIK